MNMTGAVYYWKNKINGRIYIGSSSAPKKRFYDHVMHSSNPSLKEDILRYGITDFEFGIFEFIEFPYGATKESIRKSLWKREEYYIDLHLLENGVLSPLAYNVTPSPSGLGRIFSEAQKKKMSESGQKKILTEEHKRRISQNHISKSDTFKSHAKGKVMHPNARKSIDKWLQGVKKKILQYDLEGNFISEYNSISEAGTKNDLFNENISKCVAGIGKTYGGFIWRPYIDNYLKKLELNRPPKIIMYDLEMNRMGEFENSYCVEKQQGVHHTNVSKSIRTGKPTVGYYFEYEQI